MSEAKRPLWESSAPLRVRTGQESCAGHKSSNEDSMGLFVPDDPKTLTHKGIACVISDGVSAAEAGREAAETCVQSFLSDYFSTPETWTVETSARKVLSALNVWLYRQGLSFTDTRRGFVCTLSIVVLKSRTAYFFHVGDTRIHQLRKDKLTQLTRDHTTAVSASETFLVRAMGLDSNVDIDFGTASVEPGDVFLLTTDGVHGVLTPEQLLETWVQSENPQKACEALLQRALDAGSSDNLTAQAIVVDSVPDADAEEYVNRLTALPFPPELQVGWVLDGYKVERELHSSSRSQLHLVRDAAGNAAVMKTPSANYSDDPSYIERFLLEQWIGTRVQSRHLVKSIPPPEERSCLYHLMEYVPGQTLAQWQREKHGKLPQNLEAINDMLGQVVRGLIALHRKQIFHQDLKPDNIMVDDQGVVKIIDYGSCYVAGVEELPVPVERERALGTVTYSAPEASLGIKPRPNSDLYSLGCVAYELFTGSHPYGKAAETARSGSDFASLKYTPAYAINPHVPVWVDGALRRAVQVDPQKRYQELTEFMYDLEHPNREYLDLSRDRAPADREFSWKIISLTLLIALLGSWLYFLRS